MKKIFFLATFISLVAAAACTKDPADSPSIGEGTGWEEGTVSLTFNATTDRTKVSGMVGESNVSSLQVFVFDGTKLEAEGYTGKGYAVDVKCFPGEKEAVAIANYDEIDWHNITSIEDLEQITSNLEDNSVGKFVMFGRQSLTVESTESSGTATASSYTMNIEVTRLVARVGIQTITNSTAEFYAGSLTVKAIYLINVAGHAILNSPFADFTPTLWLNKSLYQMEGGELLYSGELGISVPSGSSKDINQYFYCYPNPTADDYRMEDIGIDWIPRYTRLVVEAELKGETWYYPVSFGGVKSNHTYTVTNLTVTGPGAVGPDDGPRSTTGNAGTVVGGWDMGDVEVSPKF